MEQVLVSGSAGFIGGYVVEELLNRGYAVVGLDNFSKYGKVRKSYDDNPRYRLVEGDARDVGLMSRLLADCDYFIAGAAMIGGISYFHDYAYDLLATTSGLSRRPSTPRSPRAGTAVCGRYQPVLVDGLRERRRGRPTKDSSGRCPPPQSTYGFQKLAVEYFARGACEQYKLPYTIVRPFNCVGRRREAGAGRPGDPSAATSSSP